MVQGVGVLAGALAEQRLAGWVPAAMERQVGRQHRHAWVQPKQALEREADGDMAGALWHGLCRECLCRLEVGVEAEGVGAGNGCLDAMGHHFHAMLDTSASAAATAGQGQQLAGCRGQVRCCRCAVELRLWLQEPVVAAEVAAELTSQRQQGHTHHPTQGVRELLETVTTLFRLVKNACAGDGRPIKVDSPAPRRLLRFDAPCNQLLEIIGFARTGDEFRPPPIVHAVGRARDPAAADRAECRARVRSSPEFRRLELARDELCVWAGHLQRQVPKPERKPDYALAPAADALDEALAADGYPRRTAGAAVAGAAALEAYRALGVPADATDAVVAWVYGRLMEEDSAADPLFGPAARRRFDSLMAVEAARSPAPELAELLATERERGMVPTDAVLDACLAVFGAPQPDPTAIDSDAVRELLAVRLAETAALSARRELARHVAVLAAANQDPALRDHAAAVAASLDAAAVAAAPADAVAESGAPAGDPGLASLPVGMRNIGNTCYLNSILQCLFSLAPVRRAVLRLGDGHTWNEGRVLGRCDGGRALAVSDIDTALRFVGLLKTLFTALAARRPAATVTAAGHPLAAAAEKAQLAVAPDRELVDMLLPRAAAPPAVTAAAAAPTYFRPGDKNQQQQQHQQQDVDECMAQCVALLVHALPPSQPADGAPDGAAEATWIHSLLAGHLEVTTQRQRDGSTGATDEPDGKVAPPAVDAFLNLNLNIPADTADINECLAGFFAPAVVSSTGERPGALERRTRLKDAPPVLCLQVQRVQFDTTAMRAFKTTSHLRLRRQVSLAPFCGFGPAPGRRAELQQRIATVSAHLRALQVPAATDGASVSVVPALERAQAFMAGVGHWVLGDDAQCLLADLPHQQPPGIAQAAQDIAAHLQAMADTLHDARVRWERELSELRAEANTLYEDVAPEDPMAYTLHAVFVHSGESPEFGHYWVYIRDCTDPGRERWLKFNDSAVSVVDPDTDVFRDAPRPGHEYATPYYLVYIRSADLDEMVAPH
ncbi:ubiquitin-specific protease ubp2 [Coemansia spiralis]|nr:ubiquitin-specific protease ubp2 [Coemansia spiralis]